MEKFEPTAYTLECVATGREFVRISLKHIVNVLYVSKVEGNTILLADETLLPIPKRKVVEVRRALGSLPQRREE